jgi:hypothetical protein
MKHPLFNTILIHYIIRIATVHDILVKLQATFFKSAGKKITLLAFMLDLSNEEPRLRAAGITCLTASASPKN